MTQNSRNSPDPDDGHGSQTADQLLSHAQGTSVPGEKSKYDLLEDGDKYKYDLMDMEVIQGIGDSSASLGLVSTLVFSIAVGIAGEVDVAGQESRMIFMCMSISFSTYTTTYSLLEYYYSHCVMVLDRYLECRVPGAMEAGDSPTESSLLVHTHEDLMRRAVENFISFNNMRAWARNSTWAAINFILIATIMRLLQNGEDVGSRAWKSCRACSVLFFYAAVWWYTLNGSLDIKFYAAFSATGMITSACIAYFVDANFDMPRIVTTLVLLCGIASVVLTVRAFRVKIMPLVKANSMVF